MNTPSNPSSPGACAEFEFDIVEMVDGALPPERARALHLHIGTCARCRRYATDFSAFAASLADALPQHVVSKDFDRNLAARVAGLQRAPDRAAALAAAEREHDVMRAALVRGLRWPTALNALAVGSATAGLLIAAQAMAPEVVARLGPLVDGSPTTLAAALGVVFAAAGVLGARRLRSQPTEALFG